MKRGLMCGKNIAKDYVDFTREDFVMRKKKLKISSDFKKIAKNAGYGLGLVFLVNGLLYFTSIGDKSEGEIYSECEVERKQAVQNVGQYGRDTTYTFTAEAFNACVDGKRAEEELQQEQHENFGKIAVPVGLFLLLAGGGFHYAEYKEQQAALTIEKN
jgi:hypothetical protein